jgi:hypothetical protein
MVEAARCVQTAGFGLPVAAVALSASRTMAAVASRAGAMRHATTRPVETDA